CELYLRQSYPNACPVCGQLMRKNGFKTVYLRGLEISGRPLVLVIAKQKYLCPISAECPTLVTDLARVQGTVVNHQIIPNVQQRMLLALAEIHSVKDIANQLHVSQAT
ncbi:transposase family protein, partial [Limosilactobacillus ingluviei]|uniref:transposase family protein n=1 Tax=Limosilactobacillus ingluviei TaxID=148604 RepID=UPI00137B2B43